jgi:cytochrome c-type biogenesis protein CcmH
MTSQTTFILACALLLIVVLAILLPPLWRATKASSALDRRQANLEIFRTQLNELETDRGQGLLGASDFEQAKSELQRRLLAEVQPDGPESAPRQGGRKTALALLVAIPLAAAAAYAVLGQPQGLDALQAKARVTPQEMESMLVRLADRLKNNPDDSKGWVMLARSYKALGRFAESAEAYSHAGALLEADAVLLADYAEVLGQVHGGSLAGKPSELIARALMIDPNEPQALFLAGAAATDRQDFPGVIDYWGRLLLQLEPGSEDARALEAAVGKAREIVAQMDTVAAVKSGGKAPTKVAAAEPAKPPAAVKAERIDGEVVLSGKIAAQANPDDVLFIFARAQEGSRMPLAVIRTSVSALPLAFHLDDALALPGGQKISEFKAVDLEARVAKAGRAQSSSGDLFGSVKAVKPGSKGIKIVIDQVQP